jgi:hypothetical protein
MNVKRIFFIIIKVEVRNQVLEFRYQMSNLSHLKRESHISVSKKSLSTKLKLCITNFELMLNLKNSPKIKDLSQLLCFLRQVFCQPSKKNEIRLSGMMHDETEG